MGFIRSAFGMVAVELTSAEVHRSLQRISESGIHLYQIQGINDLTFRFWIRRVDYRRVKAIADKLGDSCELKSKTGLYWSVKSLKNRKVLVSGLLVLAVLTVYLPRRIFFVQVEGNNSVPVQMILEKASQCGIGFGASRRDVRSEKMKNALLSAIPQLQWAGVNTKGCVAVISVREKTAAEDEGAPPSVSRIVASRDAVIVGCTVEQGNAVCKVGQAVKAGELLVSGYTDCGISIKATRSLAEVYGQTSRSLHAVMPADSIVRTGITSQQKKYGLIIGKKRINFYTDSGILGESCGKMSTVNYLTLPGGFVLPVALVTEVWTDYHHEVSTVPEDRAEIGLSDFADNYLMQQMLAGRVLRRHIQYSCENRVYALEGNYACIEMIGREQSEETLGNYGEID